MQARLMAGRGGHSMDPAGQPGQGPAGTTTTSPAARSTGELLRNLSRGGRPTVRHRPRGLDPLGAQAADHHVSSGRPRCRRSISTGEGGQSHHLPAATPSFEAITAERCRCCHRSTSKPHHPGRRATVKGALGSSRPRRRLHRHRRIRRAVAGWPPADSTSIHVRDRD